ncbi:hypothetical protein BP6252_13248 [Coleophoma cylindrospora]|uniref:Heterokaryon incompatibility domain-containing protein n=1 Tax=Coleophoma cylindrospora TaxID=1849047 RepID=A0A3D8QA97_9HELO|nr:hypothetical protein BP6252_13248 [Coleophoma cylindrospora]
MNPGISQLQYEYSPLKWGEIRLINLSCRTCFCYICGEHVKPCYHRGQERGEEVPAARCDPSHSVPDVEELTGSIEIFNLRSAPPFVALSYVWGTNLSRESIVVRHPRRLITLTPNCYEALINLWKRGKRHIWVDAVCINQNDIPERNAQVAQMAKIYNSASEVAVYLGAESNDSDLAMEYLKSGKFAEGPTSDFPHRTREALIHLFRRPWFRRIWVLQEVESAKTVYVICGKAKIPFYVLRLFFIHHIERSDRLEDIPYVVAKEEIKSQRGSPETKSAGYKLLKLLCATRHCGATDPRDKYFALLSLLEESRKENLHADYMQDTSSVYIELAVYLLKSAGVEMLCAVQDPCLPLSKLHRRLPSWVPDWRNDNGLVPSIMLYQSGSMALSAGGSKHLLQAQLLQLDPSVATWSHLEVAGIELGSISALSVACNRETQPLDEILEEWQKFFYKDTMAPRSKELNSFFYTLSFGYAFSPRDDACYQKPRQIENRISVQDLVLRSQHNPSLFPRGEEVDEEAASAEYRSRLFRGQVVTATHMRRLFRTTTCDVGMGPAHADSGDVVCLFFGMAVPLLLRRCGEHYRFIGECFIDGVMYGEKMVGFRTNVDENSNMKETLVPDAFKKFTIQ